MNVSSRWWVYLVLVSKLPIQLIFLWPNWTEKRPRELVKYTFFQVSALTQWIVRSIKSYSLHHPPSMHHVMFFFQCLSESVRLSLIVWLLSWRLWCLVWMQLVKQQYCTGCTWERFFQQSLQWVGDVSLFISLSIYNAEYLGVSWRLYLTIWLIIYYFGLLICK